MKKMYSFKSWWIVVILLCVMGTFSSCLKSGDETIALEDGDATQLIVGKWVLEEALFIDDSGEKIALSEGDYSFLGQLLEFEETGNCLVDETASYPWNIGTDNDIFQLGGTTYSLVSLGESLLVIEKKMYLDGVEGILRIILSKAEGGLVDESGIPSDSEASPNPQVSGSNTAIPNVQFSSNGKIISINMSGVQNPNGGWMTFAGTGLSGQNIWVEVDGKPKGILVINNDGETSRKKMVDLVFLVDNSGSMSEEANKLAQEIVSWATKLSQQNIDIRFGCVGYGGNGSGNEGVCGALNLTDLNSISSYLNRSTGTYRTVGFGGADAASLQQAAINYRKSSGECGAEALHYADEQFSFRTGANRIYVNFTDEPNQPGSYSKNSVEYFRSQENWNTTQGTVHTVYSSANRNVSEKPWLLSEYTGGTTLYAKSDFSDVSLDALPVTGAIANSYIIQFKDNSTQADGTHTVTITILSPDGTVYAEKVFTNVSFYN